MGARVLDESKRHGSAIRERLLTSIPVRERTIRAAGISTPFLEGGEGPPVILLHGPGEFAATWSRVIPSLVKDHRVIVPDLPGQGASEIYGSALDPQRVLDWLEDLILQTDAGSPTLSGHLLGGAIALRYVTSGKSSVDRLVLVDTFGLGPLRPSPAFALAMVGFLARPNERSRDRLFRKCFVDFDSLRADMGAGWEPLEEYALDRARDPDVKSALRKLMKYFGKAIPEDELAAISIPTSLIWGREDLQVRLPVAQRAAERFGWPLHVIDGAADDPAVEQPAAFLRAFRVATDNRPQS